VTDTRVKNEMRLAVEKGYRILDIYEVYEYRVTRYDPNTGESGLFGDYINTFLKLKAEASVYPSWVRGPEDEERYVKSFWQSEGIRLDRGSIVANAGRRALAKICLNLIWGKLTDLSDRTQTVVIADPKGLYAFLTNPGIELRNMAFASDDVVWLSWKYSGEERVQRLRHSNDVIGAYVTAGARIHLYRYLDRLQEKTIYCDTVSVIYVQPNEGPQHVETGDRLGDMTSELKPSERILQFVSGGPKNYA
jgi:hypothetical protein